jgi:hypothetical protein
MLFSSPIIRQEVILLLLNNPMKLYKMCAICLPRGALHSQSFREKLDMLEESVFINIHVCISLRLSLARHSSLALFARYTSPSSQPFRMSVKYKSAMPGTPQKALAAAPICVQLYKSEF